MTVAKSKIMKGASNGLNFKPCLNLSKYSSTIPAYNKPITKSKGWTANVVPIRCGAYTNKEINSSQKVKRGLSSKNATITASGMAKANIGLPIKVSRIIGKSPNAIMIA